MSAELLEYDAVGFCPDPAGSHLIAFLSDSGILCTCDLSERNKPPLARLKHYTAPTGRFAKYRPLAGFIFVRDGGHTIVGAPYWFLLTLTLSIPAAVGLRVRLRRRRRLRNGLCTACGYDLRGSPERCPECGTVAAGRTA